MPVWRKLRVGHEQRWRAALREAARPRVLIATNLGLHFTAGTIDSLMAHALTLRGAQVEVLLCDGILPACQVVEKTLAPNIVRYAKKGPQPDFCNVCRERGTSVYDDTGIRCRSISEWLTDRDMVEADVFAEDVLSGAAGPENADRLAEHALAGALRFFGRAELTESDLHRQVYWRYLKAAYLVDVSSRRMFEQGRYEVVVAHHGIYVPQGIVADAARNADARVVTWHPSYRRGRLIFQHGDTYHRAMINESSVRWARPLSAAMDGALEDYLEARESGNSDWITFQRRDPHMAHDIHCSLGLDRDRPIDLLLSNVAWDARLHYPESAYGNMFDWAQDTVAWYAKHPERQLVVRCHPGEVLSSPRSDEPLAQVLRRTFPDWPANVKIVAANNPTNTYDLARLAERVLIFNTKMGVELAARGMPVIVAGDAWIRGKGFSHDAGSGEDYLVLLSNPATLAPLSEQAHDMARRYAYHFFFRRCMPIKALTSRSGWPLAGIAEDGFAELEPGVDTGLDAVCEGILEGTPFEYSGDAAERGEAA